MSEVLNVICEEGVKEQSHIVGLYEIFNSGSIFI